MLIIISNKLNQNDNMNLRKNQIFEIQALFLISIIISNQMTEQVNSNHLKTALVSAVFSWIGDLFLYPIDTISTRLKGSITHKGNNLHYLWNAIKKQKLKLYRGVSLTLPHSFIPTFMYVTVYEIIMEKMEKFIHKFTQSKAAKLIFPFFASGLAQFICLFFQLPFDTVRTRIQMNTQQYKYQNFMNGLREIQQKQGFFRFYKSTRIFFMCKILYIATQFQSYQMLQYYFGGTTLSLMLNTIASAVIATTTVNPLEVLITRYALVDTTKKKLVLFHMIKRMKQKEGLSAFYKGYVTELLTHVVYSLFWIPAYQIAKDKYGVKLAE